MRQYFQEGVQWKEHQRQWKKLIFSSADVPTTVFKLEHLCPILSGPRVLLLWEHLNGIPTKNKDGSMSLVWGENNIHWMILMACLGNSDSLLYIRNGMGCLHVPVLETKKLTSSWQGATFIYSSARLSLSFQAQGLMA